MQERKRQGERGDGDAREGASEMEGARNRNGRRRRQRWRGPADGGQHIDVRKTEENTYLQEKELRKLGEANTERHCATPAGRRRRAQKGSPDKSGGRFTN